MKVDQGDVEEVAEANKTGYFIRSIAVDGPGLGLGLRGHNPRRPPVEPGETNDHIRGVIFKELEEIPSVHDFSYHLVHVERF